MRTFLRNVSSNPKRISGPIEDIFGRPRNVINPLSLANGIIYLDASPTFDGLAHGTVIGTIGSTEWVNLFSPGTGNAVQPVAGLRPVLQVTSNQSPSGLQTVRFDGVDDNLENGLFPVPFPNNSIGYTWYFIFRNNLKTNPPFGTTCGVAFGDYSTSHNQIGYAGNGAANPDPPFIFTDQPAAFYDTPTIPSGWTLLSVVFDPPPVTGTCRGYRQNASGGFRTMDLHPTWNWNTALRDGYTVGDNGCPPRWDLASLVFYRGAHTVFQVQGVFNFFINKYGI